jgi:hypothetical protein
MRVLCRERRSLRRAVASCAIVLAACTVAGCSFPDVSIGNSSDAQLNDPSVQSGGNGRSGADPGRSGSSGSGSGGSSESGDAGRGLGTEGDAPDGHDGTVAGGDSSGASDSGTAGSSSGGSSGSSSTGSSGSSSGSGASGSSSGGSSGSSSTGSSGGGTGGCTCGAGQTLAYPTNVTCGTILQLLNGVSVCSGLTQGFSDDGPPCGQAGTLTTCSVVGLNLNAACVMGTGSMVTQHCQ